jgi:hypothetical protein
VKQYIVLISMIALGVFLYGLILGNGTGESSLARTTGTSMKSAMEAGLAGSAHLPLPAMVMR